MKNLKLLIMKNLLFLLFALPLLFSCGGSSVNDIKTASDLNGAKEAIDDVFDGFEIQYESLCEEKRNDQLKKKYEDLGNDIRKAIEMSWDNANLSGEEQNQAVTYAQERVNKSSKLKSLAYSGMIECW